MELIIAKICSAVALGLSCYVLGRSSAKMDDLKEDKEIEKIKKIKPFGNDNQ